MNIQAIQGFIQAHPALFIALIIWTTIWKGLALWKAAHRQEKNWFIIILVVNTFGILDIIYYYFVGKNDKDADESDEEGAVEYIQDDSRL